MNSLVAVLLAQDALTNGAIYALLGLVVVMVFSITRIVFVPQGELVTFGALTLASLLAGRVPGTVWLLIGGGFAAAAMDLVAYLRGRAGRRALRSAALFALLPLAVWALAALAVAASLPYPVHILLSLVIVAPLGPMLYRIAFQPVENASVLVLLIVAVAAHFALMGLGLLFFGAEGVRTPPLIAARVSLGGFSVSGQALMVWLIAVAMILALFLFFGRTLQGKALRATAYNRVGAKLVGISTARAGQAAFLVAGLIGAVSGILAAPITTIYYDTGFLIGLKGFIAAIFGGLGSYPLAAAGALGIGFVETFSSFYASSFKDAIVFAAIIPILLWRTLTAGHAEQEEEEE